MAFLLIVATACKQQQAKAYVSELDSNDSLSIEMGASQMTSYHSERLGIDITYPSFLRHQYLEEDQMEVFIELFLGRLPDYLRRSLVKGALAAC